MAPAIVLAAGGYRFTRLEDACLEACRSPLSLLVARWRGRLPHREARWLGARHGFVCLGCCWTPMLLVFRQGMANPGRVPALGA